MRVEKTQIKPTTRYEVARWISTIIHPIAFPLLTLALAVYFTTNGSLSAALGYTGLTLIMTSLPISALVAIQVLRHKWTDLDVSVRRQRYTLYPFGLLCMVALVLVLIHFNAPKIAIQSALALGLANIVDGLINFIYKVSAHATGAAACATIFWVATPAQFIGLSAAAIVAALLVGWSRVELKRHTPGQVALGWLVGILSVIAAVTFTPRF